MSYKYQKLNTKIGNESLEVNFNKNNDYINFSLTDFCKLFLGLFIFFFIIFLFTSTAIYKISFNYQSRLSYTTSNKTNDLTVTWSDIFNFDSNDNYLEYHKEDNPQKIIRIKPTTVKYDRNIIPKYVYRANMTDLEYNTWYNYNLKTSSGTSETFKFKVPDQFDNNYKVLVFGDLGVKEDISRNQIINEIKTYDYRFMFHLGDLAYNLQEKAGLQGDIFLSRMQEAASKVPYMVIPGNHENWDNFSNYIYRFSMPNYQSTNNLYYTIEQPPLKMININTELFYNEYFKKRFFNQIDFISKELSRINRSIYPWVVATGHRPMYCSNSDNDDCTHWINDRLRYIEDLFLKYNLTIYLSAHEHSYERICPIYNGSCLKDNQNSSLFNNSNLLYPIHVITGAAGCREGHEKFKSKVPIWSVTRNIESGFGVLNVNYKNLKWQEYAVVNNKKYLIDSFNINNL